MRKILSSLALAAVVTLSASTAWGGLDLIEPMGLLTKEQIQFAQTPVIVPAPAGTSITTTPGTTVVNAPPTSTTVDLSTLIIAGAQSVFVLVMAGIYWITRRYIKNDDARKSIYAAVATAGGYAMNKTQGAIAGRPMTVNVGSQAAAVALNYVKETVPDALKNFGIDDRTLAKMVFGRLPSIDGPVSDQTIDLIVAAASGKPAQSPNDILSQVLVAMPSIIEGVLAKRDDPKAAQAPIGAASPPATG